MLKRTERMSLRISSVLSKVEPDLHTDSGSDQKVPAPEHCSPVHLGVDLIHHQLVLLQGEHQPRGLQPRGHGGGQLRKYTFT